MGKTQIQGAAMIGKIIGALAALTIPESAEGVAFALTVMIAEMENWSPADAQPPRQRTLTLYKECLDAVTGYKEAIIELERRGIGHD
jgi:hypothetical protein